MKSNPTTHLINQVINKSALIINQLDEIEIKKFPSKNPVKLLKIMREICISLKDYTIEKSIYSSKNEDDLKKLKMILIFMAEMASHIRYIDGASAERIPWSLVQTFQNFSEKIYKDVPIILRPQWTYNFTIKRGLVNGYKLSLSSLLKKERIENIFKNELPNDVYIISFPGFEKSNILIQSILGHELGHPLAKEFLNKEREEDYMTKIRDETEKIITKDQAVDKAGETSKNIIAIKTIRNNWLSEIFSDLMAVHLFGLAAILSMYEVAIMFKSMDKIENSSRFYPPWRYRIRKMYQELPWPELIKKSDEIVKKNNAYKKIQSAIINIKNEFQSEIDIKKDEDEINKIPLYKIVCSSVEEILPKANAYIKEELSKRNVETFLSDKKSLLRIYNLCLRLDHHLPPNAIETDDLSNPQIPDMFEIINSGWFYKVAYLNDTGLSSAEDYDDYLKKTELLNRLVFKAFELRDISSKFKEKSI